MMSKTPTPDATGALLRLDAIRAALLTLDKANELQIAQDLRFTLDHITTLTAERDALLAKLEEMQEPSSATP